jgi:hypothetical protein
MASYGFTEAEARQFLEAELRRHAASTSFYWESEETDEVLDLLTEVMAKLIAANNAKLTRDWSEKGLGDLQDPMMPGI